MPRWLRQSVPCFITLCCGSLGFAQSNDRRLDNASQPKQTEIPGTAATLIADARQALVESRPHDARVILDTWIRDHDRTSGPLLSEALLLRGDALSALGDEYNALYDYERVIRDFASTPSFTIAVERELNIGVSYLKGIRFDTHDWGEELLIRVQERMPGSGIAERAGIELADYYYSTRQLELAAEAYDLFVQLYPRSQDLAKARDRLSMIRRANVGESNYLPLWRSLLLFGGAAALTRPRRSRQRPHP